MPAHFPFQLGSFQCISLQDDAQTVDVRQEMSQVAEEQLLAAMLATGYSDFNARIGFNILYVKTDEYQVLIDSGTGQGELLESMAAAGLDPNSIDYLIITHSDFDHMGGMDNFANAKIVFPKYAYDLWTTAGSRAEMIKEFKEVFSKFLNPMFVEKGMNFRQYYGGEKLPGLRDRILLVEAEEEFIPGIRMVFTPGHRPDHYAVEVESEGAVLVHIADGYRHCMQVDHPDWYTRFDSYPVEMGESLVKINARIREKGALVFGSHFGFPGLGRFFGAGLTFVDRLE